MNKNMSTQLDKRFSHAIRKGSTTTGDYLNCFICSKVLIWTSAHCAHYIGRQYPNTRYCMLNCHAVCPDCNMYDPEHRKRYRDRIREMLGPDVLVYLEGSMSLSRAECDVRFAELTCLRLSTWIGLHQ